MRYNNNRQGYDILKRFIIVENGKKVEYCRVKFLNSGREDVFPSELVAKGECTDIEDLNGVLEAYEAINKIYKEDEKDEEVIQIILPNGAITKILKSELAEYCADRNLDLEAVEKCLSGSQKSHKRHYFEII